MIAAPRTFDERNIISEQLRCLGQALIHSVANLRVRELSGIGELKDRASGAILDGEPVQSCYVIVLTVTVLQGHGGCDPASNDELRHNLDPDYARAARFVAQGDNSCR